MKIVQKHMLTKMVRFQLVALGGSLINFGCLWLCHGKLQLDLLPAAAIAIELAIIHNYSWHFFITWKHRVKRQFSIYIIKLLKYNILTASIDFYVSLGILSLLVSHINIHYLIANSLAMTAGFLIKFILNETIIFKREIPVAKPLSKSKTNY
jgi:putative flippase GtrA